jgi:hypothetical protein
LGRAFFDCAGSEDIMNSANISVFALYPSLGALRAGASALKAFGIDDEDISVLFKEDVIAETFEAGEPPIPTELPMSAPEAYIGGMLASLGYIYPTKSYAIQHSLRSLGVDLHQASFYQQCVKGGSLLICVRAAAAKFADRAAKILTSSGAVEVVRAVVASRMDTPELAFMPSTSEVEESKFTALN